jgi:AcrR family transcriptional regulator
MAAEPTGLRERKKRRTRETIVREAMALFAQHGFEGTTVADIAAAADIAPRTFFGYFPSKEEVVFHDSDEVLARFAEHLHGRAPSETTFDAMRAWIAEWSGAVDLGDEDERFRRRLIRETPALQARERTDLARLEREIAAAVATDLGVDLDSLRPHLVSAAATAALDALGRFYDQDDVEPSSDDAVAVLDEAIVFLRGGLEALRRHPSAAQRA